MSNKASKFSTFIAKHFHQLPQHIIAWILIVFASSKKIGTYKNDVIYLYKMSCSCSLGKYIFLSKYDYADKTKKPERYNNTIKHEYGHSLQSIKLGWLYLFVIGLPSVIWNTYQARRYKLDYFSFYTERWADKLGGVNRKKS